MRSAIEIRPTLRLVRDAAGTTVVRAAPGAAASDARCPARAASAVAAENRSAGSIDAVDARWVLATVVARELEGGRAAVLSPERRRAVLAAGAKLGLRPFDAGLVVAIVQDGARTGEGALSRGVEQRLRLVGAPRASRGAAPAPVWLYLLAALGLAAGWIALAVAWILD